MPSAPIPDPRVRHYHVPQRVLWTTGAVAGAERLLEPLRLQSAPWPQGAARLEHPGEGASTGGGAAVLLDFGRELHGGVRLVVGSTPGNKPVRLRIRFGESASEAMAEPFPLHGHAIHDHQVQVPWCGTHEVGSTGYRFVRIDTQEAGAVELVACAGVSLMRDLQRIGSFRSSDALLDRIWTVGADTVHLCMQELLWDGIKRDRLVWIGDMHPETQVISCVFGQQGIVPASLDFVRDQTPLPGWMNGISSYSLWWILIHRDWYRSHGDRAYLLEQQGYLEGLLRQVLARIAGDGREQLDGWRFLDWPTSGREEVVHAGLQGLTAMACAAGAEMLEAIAGAPALVGQLRAAQAGLAGHRVGHGGAKQAAALLVLAGLEDAEAINREVLAPQPTAGMSTFYGSYVLHARAAAGDCAGALELLRRYWGAMLERGATSFWEDLDLAWLEGSGRIDELTPAGLRDLHGEHGAHCYQGFRHSLCHGWAAGPTAWLSKTVLGCEPLAPGCRRLAVRPQLGGLAWAEGSFPTPKGPVLVRHVATASGVASEISSPPGIEIVRA